MARRTTPKKAPPVPHAAWRQQLESRARQLDEVADGAIEDRSWVAAVRAIERVLVIRRQLHQLDEVARSAVLPASIEAHRDELLRDVRAERFSASAAGSHTAAARLLEQELGIVVGMEPPEEEDKRPADVLLDDAAARLAKLPPAMRAKLGHR